MLTRGECLQILELDDKANKYEIETRYAMLLKRYRNQTDPAIVEHVSQITLAYNILTGRYVEPEPEDPRMEQVIWGKSRKEWLNKWQYGRLPLLFTSIGLALLIYMIISIINNKPPDMQITSVGIFSQAVDAGERVANYVKEKVPGAEEVEYQLLPIDLGDDPADPESQSAYIMKMAALLAADTIEVYICNESCYNFYAPQEIFLDLSDLYARLQDLPPDILTRIKPLRRELRPDSDLTGDPAATTAAFTPADYEAMNADTTLPISGLDVSALRLTDGLGIYGDTQVFTIGIKAGDVEKTKAFLETWIRDYQRMKELREADEAKNTTAVTTGSATTTIATTAAN